MYSRNIDSATILIIKTFFISRTPAYLIRIYFISHEILRWLQFNIEYIAMFISVLLAYFATRKEMKLLKLIYV